jgi:integrase
MKNIYREDKASSWSVRWTDLKGVRKSKSFRDKKFNGRANAYKEAEAFLKITEAQLLQGEYFDPNRNKISLRDFKHEVGLTNAKHKDATKRALEDAWESRVAPYPIADKSIGSINANDINKHMDSIRKPNGDKYSRSSLVKALEVIRVLLDTAYEMDLIKKNPAKTKLAHKSLPKQEKTKHIYLTEFQVSAISNEVAKGEFPEYANLFSLLAYTGLRSGEVRALHWTDVNFDKGTLSINKSIDDNATDLTVKDPKTDKSIRTIQLSKTQLDKLKDQKEKYGRPNCEYVFPNLSCGNALRGRWLKRRVLQPALEEIGMDDIGINLHTFRHTSVYLLVKKGAKLLAVSKRLGHASIKITADIYSELFTDVDEELAQLLDELEQTTIDHGKSRESIGEVG